MHLCNDKFEIDPDGKYLSFNLSFYHLAEKGEEDTMFYLYCEENCTDSEGRSSEIGFNIRTPNLQIDHSRQNPLLSKNTYGDHIYIATNNNQYVNYLLEFTPILYRTSAVLTPNLMNMLILIIMMSKVEQYTVQVNLLLDLI